MRADADAGRCESHTDNRPRRKAMAMAKRRRAQKSEEIRDQNIHTKKIYTHTKRGNSASLHHSTMGGGSSSSSSSSSSSESLISMMGMRMPASSPSAVNMACSPSME